ncbi:4Fe-4S binding protein [Chloroflexota bacterium]
MFINKERCTECGLCVDACPVGAVSHRNSEFYISEDCVNTLECTAQQICPAEAIERSERAEDAVLCTNCPVGCFIKPGKIGECRTYINQDGRIMTIIPVTPFESVKEIVGEECDEVIRRPFITGIGAGFRGGMDPLMVRGKVSGIDVVTCVSEAHYGWSGVLVKIDCERYIGEEGADVYDKGIKVGVVAHHFYGAATLYIGGGDLLIKKNGWVAAKVAAAIANREKVALKVKGGAKLEVQVGEKPVVNGKVVEIRRWCCGESSAAFLYTEILAGLVDEVIVVDRHLSGQKGASEGEETVYGRLTTKEEKKTKWGRLTKSGIRMRGTNLRGVIRFPETGGTGWGMTQVQSPLELIESYDPRKLKPGFTLLITEPDAGKIAFFVFTKEGKFEEAEIPEPVAKGIEVFKAGCEPARVSAFFMPCASGSARTSVVPRKHVLKLNEALRDKKACVTVGGAPTFVMGGGGVPLMVDVERVKAGSFHWTNHPAMVAPLEWTIKLKDFINIGGLVEKLRPLNEVLDEINKRAQNLKQDK